MRWIVSLALATCLFAQTADEQRIASRMKLRALPDDQRAIVTRELALEIRQLPASSPRKLHLAYSLANLATEGDFGRDTLQEVTTTLELALKDRPAEDEALTLAKLVRYEGMHADLSGPRWAAISKKLDSDDAARQSANFTLKDLSGTSWTLSALRGKVVLVNFWATWCPPCRKEMPDLEALAKQYSAQGLVVLAISTDDELEKVKKYLTEHPYALTILHDSDHHAAEAFRVEGIPKSFVFDRSGKLVAQSIDMRTRAQFLGMLAKAGLH